MGLALGWSMHVHLLSDASSVLCMQCLMKPLCCDQDVLKPSNQISPTEQRIRAELRRSARLRGPPRTPA